MEEYISYSNESRHLQYLRALEIWFCHLFLLSLTQECLFLLNCHVVLIDDLHIGEAWKSGNQGGFLEVPNQMPSLLRWQKPSIRWAAVTTEVLQQADMSSNEPKNKNRHTSMGPEVGEKGVSQNHIQQNKIKTPHGSSHGKTANKRSSLWNGISMLWGVPGPSHETV